MRRNALDPRALDCVTLGWERLQSACHPDGAERLRQFSDADDSWQPGGLPLRCAGCILFPLETKGVIWTVVSMATVARTVDTSTELTKGVIWTVVSMATVARTVDTSTELTKDVIWTIVSMATVARTVDTGTELPEQGNSPASQLGPARTADLSVIHFTENTLLMVTNTPTDINIPWHKHVPTTQGQLPQNEGDIQYTPVVPIGYSVDPKGSATSSQGIPGYISVVDTMKFTYFFNWWNAVLLNVMAKLP
jgi:hypothetical protein